MTWVLCALGEHDVQHLHGLFRGVRCPAPAPVQGDLEIGGGHDPLFAVLAKEGQKGRVDALLPKHLHAGGAAKVHATFPFGNRFITSSKSAQGRPP